jgi:hypothetical protein
MCDYYDFSEKLTNFLYSFNIKKQLFAEYNLEMHSTKTLIINIITDYETDYEYFKNNIDVNKMTLLNILNKQIFTPKNINILYNHVFDINLFEQEHDRNIYIDTIVKYYK